MVTATGRPTERRHLSPQLQVDTQQITGAASDTRRMSAQIKVVLSRAGSQDADVATPNPTLFAR
ncbi:hypothetical protein KEM60_01727 [Austwickia sp. TVS 96-490-7B]|uniref:hypothetical protein n=1 Tax=Austwickia sp. TVS 96-490-7B TaxID=2830843 RepID=UPI001C577F84|nr:hypothetical protein [Austwickia sp. TVS 96-490-7B]MBW3085527.1 hypothetical protein [Austwickia sp. TVS 96-490-7B]